MTVKSLSKIYILSRRFGSIQELPKWLKGAFRIFEQIKLMRNLLGFTQKGLAARIGGDQTMIRRIENEEVDPRLSTLKKIAGGLNCELLVSLVPKTGVAELIEKRAGEEAEKIVRRSAANAAVEGQKPDEEIIRRQIEEMKTEIITKHREILWKKD